MRSANNRNKYKETKKVRFAEVIQENYKIQKDGFGETVVKLNRRKSNERIKPKRQKYNKLKRRKSKWNTTKYTEDFSCNLLNKYGYIWKFKYTN